MDDIGLIGVGFIGKRFLDALLEAGHSVTAYDIDPDQRAFAAERGADIGSDPAAVGQASDAVLLALPGSPAVEATMTGSPGLLDALSPGDIVIDATTTSIETALAQAQACREANVHWVSAPLTRSAPVPGIHMMVGATDEAYEAAAPIIGTVSEEHRRIGAVEDALQFKYLLQIRYAAGWALDAEIVELARDRDVDPRPLVDFLGMDVDQSLLADDYIQSVEGLGAIDVWRKDLGYALEAARTADAAVPLTAAVHEAYKHAHRLAEPDEGNPATIARYWRALNGRD